VTRFVLTSLVLLVPLLAPALAQDGARLRSHLGVEVSTPQGFAKSKAKPNPTTAIHLEEKPDGPAFVVNAMKMGANLTEEELYKQTRETFEKEGEVVKLASGSFLRVELELELEGGKKLVQRCYAGLRGRQAYYFFLARTSPKDFQRLAPAFKAFVAGAKFFPPEPKPEPAEETPAPVPAEDLPKPAPKAEEPKGEQPKGESPEPAPKGEQPKSEEPKPGKPAPKGKARVLKRVGLRLVSYDSEFDPDQWAARNLVDGSPTSGWCSSPARTAPHRFVFDLGSPQRLARLELDAACADEGEYAGVGAKDYLIEGSLKGPNEGFETLLEGTLARGKNAQALELPPSANARWLRLTLKSNFGHAELTELMEVRAYARGVLGFHLERTRLSRKRNGAASAEAFAAGERVWVNFKPRGLSPNAEGKTWLSVDLILEDARGKVLLTREKVVDHVGVPPARPLSQFVSLYLTIPKAFPPGSYSVRLLARDGFGESSAAARLSFEVAKK
jgi:F5/8 type C domain-containing protein